MCVRESDFAPARLTGSPGVNEIVYYTILAYDSLSLFFIRLSVTYMFTIQEIRLILTFKVTSWVFIKWVLVTMVPRSPSRAQTVQSVSTRGTPLASERAANHEVQETPFRIPFWWVCCFEASVNERRQKLIILKHRLNREGVVVHTSTHRWQVDIACNENI